MIRTFYHVSVGAWIMSLFITASYDDPVPMWVLLVIMNVLNIMSIHKRDEDSSSLLPVLKRES